MNVTAGGARILHEQTQSSADLEGIDLVLDVLDVVLRCHQLSLLGGHVLPDLLGFLLVQFQVAQLHLTLFDRVALFETQLAHRLQSFNIPE